MAKTGVLLRKKCGKKYCNCTAILLQKTANILQMYCNFKVLKEYSNKPKKQIFGSTTPFSALLKRKGRISKRKFCRPNGVPDGIRTHGLSLRRSPRGTFSTPYKSPKVLDFTGFSEVLLSINSRP
ncbi:MAG: hypothetical protein PUE08_05805, partial [Eubacteriales bacterium]|nr:hypothetical protein [Eubacteriales bacterium]